MKEWKVREYLVLGKWMCAEQKQRKKLHMHIKGYHQRETRNN